MRRIANEVNEHQHKKTNNHYIETLVINISH